MNEQPQDKYPDIDMDAFLFESWAWKPTPQLRWHRPKGGGDADIALEQMWERITGECHWRPVQTILED
jgi:hypothetical protein